MANWAVPGAHISFIQTLLHGVQMAHHELLLFAGFWFVIGFIDEAAIDLLWMWLRLRGRVPTPRAGSGRLEAPSQPLSGIIAVFIPVWCEADVIGATIAHALKAWPQSGLRLYVGCYRNDPATLAAAMAAAGCDPRVRLVVHGCQGPTTKADCLNRLYAALVEDERRGGVMARAVVLHDAEDMVHPQALAVMDRALDHHDFVQLPVRPELQRHSRWVAGHYADEFAESHAKTMVVRDWLGAALPSAGVGCAVARDMLSRLAGQRGANGTQAGAGPFAADCLTEDYEMGWLIARNGGRSRFLRLRDAQGRLIATRAYFPATFGAAVRQKARWIHGISLQGWDRLGWWGRTTDLWMAMRDRRGPLAALVMGAAYLLIVLQGVLLAAALAGLAAPLPVWGRTAQALMAICAGGLIWRALFRFLFTAREYGLAEGLLAIARIPVDNLIMILAGRRAFTAYLRTLAGEAVRWEKTAHQGHPSLADTAGANTAPIDVPGLREALA